MMLSTLVCSAIWRNWLNFDGFLNALLAAFGIEGVRWLSDPHLALWSLALVDVWQWTPMAFLIVLAGLQSIPQELYEAARTDGASSGSACATSRCRLRRRRSASRCCCARSTRSSCSTRSMR